MKLLPTNHPSGMAPGTDRKTAAKAAEGFRQALETALDGKPGPNAATSAAAPASLPAAVGLEAIGHRQPRSGIQRLERFIDALDAYRQRLDNPRCELKDVAPSLERLEHEHRRLSQWAETAAVDNKLQALVDESLVTATLEIHRFRSGRYC